MLGIIGGTGLYNIEGVEIIEEKKIDTPFGEPSAAITISSYKNTEFAFIPRHGNNHTILPSEINYRANIWAMKAVGVRKIISVSATGSLTHNIKPSDLVLPSQYFDWTKGKRENTFFGNGIVAHISSANPICDVLADDITKAAKKLAIELHTDKTYACVEGSRLGTKAESFFLKKVDCDIVGMTNVPEAFLAREAQLSYCTIAIVTDFDCWLDDTSQHAGVEKIIEEYGRNVEKIKSLIKELITSDLGESPDYCRKSLDGAMLTPESVLSEEQKNIMHFLRL